jgi:hypothetical protein
MVMRVGERWILFSGSTRFYRKIRIIVEGLRRSHNSGRSRAAGFGIFFLAGFGVRVSIICNYTAVEE